MYLVHDIIVKLLFPRLFFYMQVYIRGYIFPTMQHTKWKRSPPVQDRQIWTGILCPDCKQLTLCLWSLHRYIYMTIARAFALLCVVVVIVSLYFFSTYANCRRLGPAPRAGRAPTSCFRPCFLFGTGRLLWGSTTPKSRLHWSPGSSPRHTTTNSVWCMTLRPSLFGARKVTTPGNVPTHLNFSFWEKQAQIYLPTESITFSHVRVDTNVSKLFITIIVQSEV